MESTTNFLKTQNLSLISLDRKKMIWTHLSLSPMEILIKIFQRNRKALRSISLQVMRKSKHPTRKIQEISITTITTILHHHRMIIMMRK